MDLFFTIKREKIRFMIIFAEIMKKLVILSLISIAAFLTGCSLDEDFNWPQGGRITCSCDTVSFDTVFSAIGSATQRFLIYNKESKAVRLPQIKLASGGSSGFRVNIDGISGTSFQDVEINHEDSIWVFVEVTVDPHDQDSPILITDSLVISQPNGVTECVVLTAWGQDVIIKRGEHITTDASFDAKRPYVVYDSLVVDSGVVLTIKPGVTLCFHEGADMRIKGNIVAEGTPEQPIIFRGDRTDRLFSYLPYDRTDGQWGGIQLFNITRRCDNVFKCCDIHGGNYGVKSLMGSEPVTLQIIGTTIHNVHGHGLDLKYGKAYIENSQITNTFGNCVNIIGGLTQFYYTTIAQFYPWDAERGHAVYFANIEDSLAFPLHELTFTNCIITGYGKDEMYGTRYAPQEGENDVDFNYAFKYSLVLTDTTTVEQEHYTGCVFDVDTTFSKTKNFKTIDTKNYVYNFELDSISKARHIGINIPNVQTDKNGYSRPAANTDAGCYQYR